MSLKEGLPMYDETLSVSETGTGAEEDEEEELEEDFSDNDDDKDEEEEEDEEEDDDDQSSLCWISWFCGLPGHEFFTEVPEEYIDDHFNLVGIPNQVPFFREAMDLILNVDSDDSVNAPDVSMIESSAELLYGLVHQRYIITRPGLQQMRDKYNESKFGHCPRTFCMNQRVLPIGRSDLPGEEAVKLFCPSCLDIYVPPSSRFHKIDGAYFGTTFPHCFLLTFTELAVPEMTTLYQPKIFGFKVSELSNWGPRMQWIRYRTDENKKDENPTENAVQLPATPKNGELFTPSESSSRPGSSNAMDMEVSVVDSMQSLQQNSSI